MMSRWLSHHHWGEVVGCVVIGGHLAHSEARGAAAPDRNCSICLEQLAQAGQPGLLAILNCDHW